jgi:hypothetical protein
MDLAYKRDRVQSGQFDVSGWDSVFQREGRRSDMIRETYRFQGDGGGPKRIYGRMKAHNNERNHGNFIFFIIRYR